ncbi:hypothetical protein CPC08DRAFT_748124 [Agrocybe pediades]|nr:hypothetical protein CPC08DRAFT_748124 [Agrocybe pediades]
MKLDVAFLALFFALFNKTHAGPAADIASVNRRETSRDIIFCDISQFMLTLYTGPPGGRCCGPITADGGIFYSGNENENENVRVNALSSGPDWHCDDHFRISLQMPDFDYRF